MMYIYCQDTPRTLHEDKHIHQLRVAGLQDSSSL